ncbi:permease-like cell division protein FtsX [Thermoactinospora rubra]|uniref:permease-like cell division protein FtsX n=1 Tax=Thermoactinospora rubra TaxID=1088767 RepID=UPI000A0F8616|nr:permease-like cell division protein FtsX [Thermoactinospora rubra]
MRANFILSEVWIGLRRNLTMTIAVIVTVAVGMAMFGVGLLIWAQVNTMKDFWDDKVEVSVFMCTKNSADSDCKGKAITPDQVTALQERLKSTPGVTEVIYEGQEAAYRRFQENQAVEKTLREVTRVEDMPTSFRVKLANPDNSDVVVKAAEGQPGVSSVKNHRDLLDDFFGLLDSLQLAAFALAIIVVIASILLIANTVRLSAYNRRRETAIMRLVGASNVYIQLPFVMEGMIAGLVGGVVSSVMLIVAKIVIFDRFQAYLAIGSQLQWDTVASAILGSLVAGVLICVLASFVTLRRYLRV